MHTSCGTPRFPDVLMAQVATLRREPGIAEVTNWNEQVCQGRTKSCHGLLMYMHLYPPQMKTSYSVRSSFSSLSSAHVKIHFFLPPSSEGFGQESILSFHRTNLSLLFLFFSFLSFFFFCFLGSPMQHMEVSRLGVESELKLLATATATATRNLSSSVTYIHHNSRQHRIPSPLNEARDRTHILMDTSWIRFHCTTAGTPHRTNLNIYVPISQC